MANIFLAIPQYKKIPKNEIQRIRNELIKEGWEPMKTWEPMFDGMHPAVDFSLQSLSHSKHRFRQCILRGDGNLPRIRSIQFGIWRYEYDNKDTRCDYFMTLDDDVSFMPEAIDILVEDDKQIVGGVYTFKTDNPDYLGKPCSRLFDEGQEVYPDKPFPIRWLNGGFILSRADALLKMIDAYKDLEIRIPTESGLPANKTFALWLDMVEDKNFLGEDWSFCERARRAGIEIWGELRTNLVHWNAEYGYSITLEPQKKDINKIEGWMSEQELAWLFWKSKEMESIAEIGSWKGRSTYALLSGCKGTVYAVDHFRGDGNSKTQVARGGEDIYQDFLKNVGHFPNLKLMKMDSLEASEIVDKVDMTFIDGTHTREAVKSDIKAWLRKTKKLICGHDYTNPSVKEAVTEMLGEVKTYNSIWFKLLR